MCDKVIRSHMGLHYSKVDAALSAEIDPSTLCLFWITHSSQRETQKHPRKPHSKSRTHSSIRVVLLIGKF